MHIFVAKSSQLVQPLQIDLASRHLPYGRNSFDNLEYCSNPRNLFRNKENIISEIKVKLSFENWLKPNAKAIDINMSMAKA